jgi:hypothetical protein
MKRAILNMDITKLIQGGQFDAVVNELTPFSLLEGSARRSFCDRHQKQLVSAFHACCKQGKHELVPLFLGLVRGERGQALTLAATHAKPLVIRALLDETDDKARSVALEACLQTTRSGWKSPKERAVLLTCMDLLLERGARPIEPAVKACLRNFDPEVYSLLISSNNFNDADIHATFNSAVAHGHTGALPLLIAHHKPTTLPAKMLAQSLSQGAAANIELLMPLCDHTRAMDLIDKRFPISLEILDRVAEELSFDACQKLMNNGHPLPPSIRSRLVANSLRKSTQQVGLVRARPRI